MNVTRTCLKSFQIHSHVALREAEKRTEEIECYYLMRYASESWKSEAIAGLVNSSLF